MKYVIIFILTILLSAQYKSNSSKTVDWILKQNSYKIEMIYFGCFDSGIITIEVDNSRKIAYCSYDNSSSQSPIKTNKTQWNSEKNHKLSKIFKKGIKLKEHEFLCTLYTRYKLSSSFYFVEFEDLNCYMNEELYSFMNDILL